MSGEIIHDPGGSKRFRLQDGVRGQAEFSPCWRYRHWLSRWWKHTGRAILWIGMNPSTAEADIDDPTIRREITFSMKWGYAGIIKCNVMDYRATHQRDLLAIVPVSDRNRQIILSYARHCDTIVAAWGVLPKKLRSHADDVIEMLLEHGYTLLCLGITSDGSPRHPLYVSSDTELIEWKIPGSMIQNAKSTTDQRDNRGTTS